MAKRTGKPPSRLELRKAAEAAEKKAKAEGKSDKKKAATTKKKKPSKRKTAKVAPGNERLRLLWGVFDNSNQQIAAFPYSQRHDAEKKLKDMEGKPRGPFFLQPVKEPIIEAAAEEEES